MRQDEHRLQVSIMRYWELAYGKYERLLFAIPNGGRRDAVTGAKLKAEGVRTGVADLFLAMPSSLEDGIAHGTFIEVKTARGRCTPAQRAFGQRVVEQGYLYLIVRSMDDFILMTDILCSSTKNDSYQRRASYLLHRFAEKSDSKHSRSFASCFPYSALSPYSAGSDDVSRRSSDRTPE